jgi:two-component system chemotaxis response regulator CheY
MAKTVVIIDDSKFIIDALVKFFTAKLRFEVIGTGRDGIEAIELYRKKKPDLLTLDITMPNKDGTQVIGELLKEFPDAKILVVSAVRGVALIECVDAGAANFISKPLTFHNPAFVEQFENIVNKIVP